MDLSYGLFSEYNEKKFSEKIIGKIIKGEWNDILNGLCIIKDNAILLNYIYFKYFATNKTYNHIVNFITNNIDKILVKSQYFCVCVNMKSLTLGDLDKHKVFIQNISIFLTEKYPDKLSKCYIYNAPFIFSRIYKVVSTFIDKTTQEKIELVKDIK